MKRTFLRLCTVACIQRITAWTIIAEIGVDMTKFPTPDQLASWAGLCPGNSESAGKHNRRKLARATGIFDVSNPA